MLRHLKEQEKENLRFVQGSIQKPFFDVHIPYYKVTIFETLQGFHLHYILNAKP